LIRETIFIDEHTFLIDRPSDSDRLLDAFLRIGTVADEVRREDLRAIQWPADAVPMGAFSNPDELVGRGLIQPVTQNEVFLPSKLAAKEAGAGLPPIIPEGYRALSVRVNDVVGVAGYVLPGTRVDVLATVNPTQRPEDVDSLSFVTSAESSRAGRGTTPRRSPGSVSIAKVCVRERCESSVPWQSSLPVNAKGRNSNPA
jgi:hypothetical protein